MRKTTEVKGDGGSKVVGLEYRDRVSGDIHNIELAGIFVQIGLLPNTNWLEGAVERNRMGEIIIDAKCETNVKACSQRVTVRRFRTQIIIATGEGAKASECFDSPDSHQNCIRISKIHLQLLSRRGQTSAAFL